MAKKTKSKTKSVDAVQFLEDLCGGPLTLGSWIETIRVTDEYTFESMARLLGVSRGHLCDIEKGRKGLSPERAAKWAKLLGYSEAQFVALSLQASLDAAGLKYSVKLDAAA